MIGPCGIFNSSAESNLIIVVISFIAGWKTNVESVLSPLLRVGKVEFMNL